MQSHADATAIVLLARTDSAMRFDPVIYAQDPGWSFITNVLKSNRTQLAHDFESHVVNWCRENERQVRGLPMLTDARNHNQREAAKKTNVRELLRSAFGMYSFLSLLASPLNFD